MNLLEKYLCLLLFISSLTVSKAQNQQPFILIVQPIILQSDEGTDPASVAVPEVLVDRAYQKSNVDFYFLEPIYYNNTKARDGLINLDQIVKEAKEANLIKGQNDIVNMFFVNAVDGNQGPLGRGMMGGNITFISLGANNDTNHKDMQAFVIAHEVGHNLSLQHAVDDPNVPDTIPNIQGDGDFKDRIDPKYSLNQHQIDIIHQSQLIHPRIDFLSIDRAAKAILDETYEPYFSKLQIREIEAFVGEKVPTTDIEQARIFAKDKFSSAVDSFTTDEKACLNFVTKNVNKILRKKNITLMSNHPWRFIKIKNWLCGGFAHTRGTYIILSQKHIDYLSSNWSDNMTKEDEIQLITKLGSLLVHEQMHSLQRTFKSKFTRLYTEYWNFKNAIVVEEDSIQIDQVSNPDAPMAEWLIPNQTEENLYYWVRTQLKKGKGIPKMGRDFIDHVYIVQEQNNGFKVKKDQYGTLLKTSLLGIEFYKESFPKTNGLDHPNEIAAYMFSDYFVSLISNTIPYDNAPQEAANNSKLFVEWINDEMGE